MPQHLEERRVALHQVHALEHLHEDDDDVQVKQHQRLHQHHVHHEHQHPSNLLELLGEVFDDLILLLPLCWIEKHIKLWIFYEPLSPGPGQCHGSWCYGAS